MHSLLFNEGYNAHAGEDLIRNDLCGEGLRLGRLVAQSPHVVGSSAPTAHALVALMAFQSARLPARVDANGEMVLLEDQDRALWDHQLVALGFAHFERSIEGETVTAYHIQAAIAAEHAKDRPDAVRWPLVLRLYDDLVELNPSSVIRLNRAVAVSRVHGIDAGLRIVEALEQEPALAQVLLVAVGQRAAADGARGSRRCSRLLSHSTDTSLHGTRASVPVAPVGGVRIVKVRPACLSCGPTLQKAISPRGRGQRTREETMRPRDHSPKMLRPVGTARSARHGSRVAARWQARGKCSDVLAIEWLLSIRDVGPTGPRSRPAVVSALCLSAMKQDSMLLDSMLFSARS